MMHRKCKLRTMFVNIFILLRCCVICFYNMTRIVFVLVFHSLFFVCSNFKQRFILHSLNLLLPFSSISIFGNSSLFPLSLALFRQGQGPSLRSHEKQVHHLSLPHQNNMQCFECPCIYSLLFPLQVIYAFKGYSFWFPSFLLRILLPLMRILITPLLMRILFLGLEPGWCPLLFGWKILKLWDFEKGKKVESTCPEELYDSLFIKSR